MRKSLLPLALLATTAMSSAHAGFGLPKLPGLPSVPGLTSSSSSFSADSVEQFIAVGQDSATLINTARYNLAMALSTKEMRAQLAQQQAQIKAGLDAKDQKAQDQNKTFQASLDAELKAKLESDAARQQLASLTADQLKLVADSAVQLGYGILLQKEQITTGQNMISAISGNPMLVTKLPAIKNAVGTMTSNISGAGSYVFKLPALLKSANISITLPTDTSSKPTALAASNIDWSDSPAPAAK